MSQYNKRVLVALGSAILALLVVGAISYRGMTVSGESNRWVRHSHQVIGSLHNLLFSVERIESSCRGFLLTGNESYLLSYRAGVAAARQDEVTIHQLTLDNAEQQRRIPSLSSLVEQKIDFSEKLIGVRRDRGSEAASNAIQNGSGQEIMDVIQLKVGDLLTEELHLLGIRDAVANRRRNQTRTILVIGTALGLLVAVGTGWTIYWNFVARDLAENGLRENEERFRTLANNISQFAWMADKTGKTFWYNQRWFEYTGTTLEQMSGWGWEKVLHPDHLHRVVEKITECFRTGEIWEDTFPLRGRDGKYRLFLSRAVPIRDAEGKIFRWLGTNTDITERQYAAHNLAQIEGRYRGLLEAAPDAMVVVNPDGEIVLLNVQAENQFGYRRDELVGQKVKNIIPEGFAERLVADALRSAKEALAQQIGTGIELIGRRKDGTEFPIEIMLSPLESAEGILVTAAIRDISVRKAAEKNLGQMEARYRGLLEAAPDAMVVVNADGEIVLLNVQAENQFGYRRDELVGQKVKNIIPEGFAERLIADGTRSAKEALAQQIGTGIELIGRRKDGTDFPIEIMLSPLESAEGILVTAAIRDITNRKVAEANLLHKVDELNRSNEELGQFAYIASHDLQEPLLMVASYTQLLAKRYKGKLDTDADEFIAFAVDGASRMQRLIQDLLRYSRVGMKVQELLDISSEAALQEAIKNLRSSIEESGARVTHDALPEVQADQMQLVQLFQNLVGNGIKYQPPGVPRVHISAARNGEMKWIFSVRDNGLGIDSKYFDKIFGLFQRLHKREEFAGTGIGLAICKKIVERHGSTISVDSEPGQGATFRFALAAAGSKS